MAYVFDFQNTLIEITSPQTDVDIQELIDEIRTVEASSQGIAYPKIANAAGKESLGAGVEVGITVDLLNGWQLHFWSGSYTATIAGGNLVGGPAGDPIAYTAGVQVVLIQSAAATIVSTGGSALTQEEHDKLFAVADDVWDEQLSGHTGAGSTGKILSDVLAGVEDSLGVSGENTKWSGMAFDSNDNLISAVITQYTDNTLTVEQKKWQLTATYDLNSRLTAYQLKEY
jgi:hypothetical protein